MQTILFHALDKPGTTALRDALREAHRAHIRISEPKCRCVMGGPQLSFPDDIMRGTALVFEAPDPDTVQAFMADDPYVLAGLFASVSIFVWRIGLGQIA